MILFTPGPCMTTDSVRQAAAQPDLNHREPRYLGLIRDVKASLVELAPGFHPYLVGGSGTAAMEAMAASLVRTGPVLVLSDGYYSQRMEAILQVHGIPTFTLEFDWLAGWDLERVAEALDKGSFEAVAMTHHETTTGRLNPVEEAAALARARGVRVLVDAISSFGADPLGLENVDAFCCTSNKCLHGLPGVGFVMTRELAPVEPVRSYYLHLARYEGDKPPLTPPVPSLLAFQQALAEHRAQGGRPAREARYRRLTGLLREGLSARGYELPVAKEKSSSTLVMAPLPVGSTYQGLFDHCFEEGFVIYGSKGPLSERMFQLSVMGEVAEAHVQALLAILPRFGG